MGAEEAPEASREEAELLPQLAVRERPLVGRRLHSGQRKKNSGKGSNDCNDTPGNVMSQLIHKTESSLDTVNLGFLFSRTT